MAHTMLKHKVRGYRVLYFDEDWNELEALRDEEMPFEDALQLLRGWRQNREWLRQHKSDSVCLLSQAVNISIEEIVHYGA